MPDRGEGGREEMVLGKKIEVGEGDVNYFRGLAEGYSQLGGDFAQVLDDVTDALREAKLRKEPVDEGNIARLRGVWALLDGGLSDMKKLLAQVEAVADPFLDDEAKQNRQEVRTQRQK